MLSYSAHNSKTVLVKGDKKKFASLLKQVDGRWNTKQDGWVVPIENEKKLKNLMNALYPEDAVKEEVVAAVEVKKDDTAAKAESDDESKHKDSSKRDDEDTRRYRRSRSPPSSPSSSSSSDDQSPPRRKDKKQPDNKIDKYYQSFKKSPRSFGSNLYDDDHIHLSSSSSSDSDSSSPDFPNPSPKRDRHVTDAVLDKMEAVRRRLRQMELEEKDRKKRR
jgi:hypothetical protein